jgi:predicted enzyme related to lactoylglutathione lyase
VLPPLNEPPTADRLEGKFIWADLFTPDPIAAARFYGAMFQWEAVTATRDGHTHVLLRHEGRPVAGIVQRADHAGTRSGRWVEYVAVSDMARTLKAVQQSGGQVLAPARDFPRRGIHALCADNQGAVLGLLQSASGDTADYRAEVGDWIWTELLAPDPHRAAAFYRDVFGYTVTPSSSQQPGNPVVLTAGGFARAGIVPLPPQDEGRPAWISSIRVLDTEAAANRALAMGGRVLVSPHLSHLGARLAIIADPTGGALGVIEFRGANAVPSTP